MDNSQFSVSECSLPPMVEGPVEGEVEVCIPLLFMVTSRYPVMSIRKCSAGRQQPIQRSSSSYTARLLWWGEVGMGTVFHPKLATSSKQMQFSVKRFEGDEIRTKNTNKTIFPIQSKIDSIQSYFTDMGKLTVEVLDSKCSIVGRCIVPMDEVATGNHHASVSGRYPILPVGGRKKGKTNLGELYFCLRLRMGSSGEVQHSYLLHEAAFSAAVAATAEVDGDNGIDMKQRSTEQKGKNKLETIVADDSLKEEDTIMIPVQSVQLKRPPQIGRPMLDEDTEKGDHNQSEECRLKDEEHTQLLLIKQEDNNNQLGELCQMHGEDKPIEMSVDDDASAILHPRNMKSSHTSREESQLPQCHRSSSQPSHQVFGSSPLQMKTTLSIISSSSQKKGKGRQEIPLNEWCNEEKPQSATHSISAVKFDGVPVQMKGRILHEVSNDNDTSAEVHYDAELLAQLLERGEHLRKQMITASENMFEGESMSQPPISVKLNDERGGLNSGSYLSCSSSDLPPFSLPTDCLYSVSAPVERDGGVLRAILDAASPPPASLAFPSVAMGDIARVEALASVRFLRIRLHRLVMFGSSTSNAQGCGWQLRFRLPPEAEPFDGLMTVSFPVVPNNNAMAGGHSHTHSRRSTHALSSKNEKAVGGRRKGHGAVHLSLGETIISSETVCAIYMSDAVASRWIPTEGNSSSSSHQPSEGGCGIDVLLIDGQSESPPPPESDSIPPPLVSNADRVTGLAHVPLCYVLMSPSLSAVSTVDIKEVVHGGGGGGGGGFKGLDSSSRKNANDGASEQRRKESRKPINHHHHSEGPLNNEMVVGKRSVGTISVEVELLPAASRVSNNEEMKLASGPPAAYSNSVMSLDLLGEHQLEHQMVVPAAKRRNEGKCKSHSGSSLNDSTIISGVPDLPLLEGKEELEKNQRRLKTAAGGSSPAPSSSKLTVGNKSAVVLSEKRKVGEKKCKGSGGAPEAVLNVSAVDDDATVVATQQQRQAENQSQSVGSGMTNTNGLHNQSTDSYSSKEMMKPVLGNVSVKIISAVDLEPVKLLSSGMTRTIIPPSVLEIISQEGTKGISSIRIAYVLGWGGYSIQEGGDQEEQHPHMKAEAHGIRDDKNECWLFSHYKRFPLQLRRECDTFLGLNDRVLIFEVWIKCGDGDEILLGLAKASLDVWSSAVEGGTILSLSNQTIFPVIEGPLDVVNPFCEECMGTLIVCLTLCGPGPFKQEEDAKRIDLTLTSNSIGSVNHHPSKCETVVALVDVDKKAEVVVEEFQKEGEEEVIGYSSNNKQSSNHCHVVVLPNLVTVEEEERHHHRDNVLPTILSDGQHKVPRKRKQEETSSTTEIGGHFERNSNTRDTNHVVGHSGGSFLKNNDDIALEKIESANIQEGHQRQEDERSEIDSHENSIDIDITTTAQTSEMEELRNHQPKGVVVGEVVSCAATSESAVEGFIGYITHTVEFGVEGIAPLGSSTNLQKEEGEELTRVLGCVISYNLLGRNHELWWDRYSAVLNTKQRHRIRVREGNENVLSVLFSSEIPKELVMELYAEPEDHNGSREHLGSVSLPICDLEPLLLGNSSSIHLSLPVIPPPPVVDHPMLDKKEKASITLGCECSSTMPNRVSILQLCVERRQEPQAVARRRIAGAELDGVVCRQLLQYQSSSPETRHVVLRLTAIKKCCITLHFSPVAACPETDLLYSSPLLAAEELWEFRVPINFAHEEEAMLRNGIMSSLVVELDVNILEENNRVNNCKWAISIPFNDLLLVPGTVRLCEPGLPMLEAFIERKMIEYDKDDERRDNDQEEVGEIEDDRCQLNVHSPTMWQQQLGATPLRGKKSSTIEKQQPVVELFLERVLNLPAEYLSSSAAVYVSYSWRLNGSSIEESAGDPSPAIDATEGGRIVFNCLCKLSNPVVMLPLEEDRGDKTLWYDSYALVVRIWRRFEVLPPVPSEDGSTLRDDLLVGSVMVDLSPLRHVPIDGWYHLYDEAHWQVGQIKFRISQSGGGSDATAARRAPCINGQGYSEGSNNTVNQQQPRLMHHHLHTEKTNCVTGCPPPAVSVFEEDVTVATTPKINEEEEFSLSFANVRRDMERVTQWLMILSSEETPDHLSLDLPLKTTAAIPVAPTCATDVTETVVKGPTSTVVAISSTIRNREIRAAQIIQSAWRSTCLRNQLRLGKMRQSSAAVTIQTITRGFAARRWITTLRERKKSLKNDQKVLQPTHSLHEGCRCGLNSSQITATEEPRRIDISSSVDDGLEDITMHESEAESVSSERITEIHEMNVKVECQSTTFIPPELDAHPGSHDTSTTVGMGLEEEKRGRWQMNDLVEVAGKVKERTRLAPFSATDDNNKCNEEGRRVPELARLLRPRQFSDTETARIARIMQGSLSKAAAEESD